MISFELGAEDLADTRFALSPLYETVVSLRVLREPELYALHLPWRRSVLGRYAGLDTALLMALEGRTRALPDFLTPRPPSFASAFEEEMAAVRRAPADLVRRDLLAAHAPGRVPDALSAAVDGTERAVGELRDTICDLLEQYWNIAIRPAWPKMRPVLAADMAYRARQLATGGARRLFADMHPNLRWRDGVLYLDQMTGRLRVPAAGRGLLLVPSVFAHMPAPLLRAEEAPLLRYPCRGVASLWVPAPASDAAALASLLGMPRARLLGQLEEPLASAEIARRLGVTPSAVSQHLQVLHAIGLVTRARDGRHVRYRRSPLGDQLIGQPGTHKPCTAGHQKRPRGLGEP
jgi:DNA-binding transcriptional ArsR family regulator